MTAAALSMGQRQVSPPGCAIDCPLTAMLRCYGDRQQPALPVARQKDLIGVRRSHRDREIRYVHSPSSRLLQHRSNIVAF